MIIGQGSGIFYNPPDEKGGGETLAETLVLGNVTGGNDIDYGTDLAFWDSGNTIGRQGANTLLINSQGITRNKLKLLATILNLQADSITNTSQLSLLGNSGGFFVSNSAFTLFTTIDLLPDNLSISHSNGAILNYTPLVGWTLKGTASKFYLEHTGTYVVPSDDKQYVPKRYVDDSIAYSEQFSIIFNNTVNATWEQITLPGAPINKEVDILITNTLAANRNGGVRKVGSLLARIGATNSDSLVMTVITDSSGDIEIFSSSFADIDFRVIGIRG